MATQVVASPWEVADNPPPQTFQIWGQVSINAWFCSLVKGMGKVPYDPNTLDERGNPARRYTAIDITIEPLQASGNQYPTERHMLAEFGEWPDIVLPSLRDLGVTPQALDKKFACAELVPTGRKYTNSNGDEKDATTVKFIRVYDNEAAAKAAYGGNGAAPSTSNVLPWDANDPATQGTKEKETALQFLKVYVSNALRSSGKDLEKARAALGPMLEQQALLKKYFTVDSPEVLDLMAAELAK